MTRVVRLEGHKLFQLKSHLVLPMLDVFLLGLVFHEQTPEEYQLQAKKEAH